MEVFLAASAPGLEAAATTKWMHLRDLVSGLQSGHPAARELVQRLDPEIADQLRAMVVHRGSSMADFVAEVLVSIAHETAEAAWSGALAQYSANHDDPEAALLGRIVEDAMRRRLRAELLIASDQDADGEPFALRRVGHPHKHE